MSYGTASEDERQPLLPHPPSLLTRAVALGEAGDLVGAFELTERAALEGEPGAWTSCGNLYAKGIGTRKSKTDAVQCYRRARRAGDVKGTGLLAMCMITGAGMPPEREEGLRILLEMAIRGDFTAIRNCVWIYRYGEKFGVPRDDEVAKRWLHEAQLQRAERHAATLRRAGSVPKLHSARQSTSQDVARPGPYGAGFHLTDSTSSSTLFAPPDADTLAQSSYSTPRISGSAPIEVPVHALLPLRTGQPHARSVPNASADLTEAATFALRQASPRSPAASHLPRRTENSQEGQGEIARLASSTISPQSPPTPVGATDAASPGQRPSSSQQLQRRSSSQQLKPPLPPAMARRQSMATLLDPLNSMKQNSQANICQDTQYTSSPARLSDARNLSEQALPPRQAATPRWAESMGVFPSQSNLPLGLAELHVSQPTSVPTPPDTAVYGATTVVVDLAGSSSQSDNSLSYVERFVIQCDVRHVGIPLGCTAFTGMWRAMALSFKSSAGVTFVEGQVPYLSHFVEYAMQSIWFAMWFFTVGLYLIFLSVYIYRSVRLPVLLFQDFEDPVLTNFFAAIAIVAGVLTIATPPPVANPNVIEAMFCLLLAYKAFLSVGFWYTDWLFSTGHNSLRRTSPIFFMAVINFFILSTIAASIKAVELAVFLFLLGSLMWLIVFTTSFSFIAKTYEHGVDKPSPTLFCFLAPYVSRNGTAIPRIVHSCLPLSPF
jgi:Voltage-dependent anion channel